MQATVYRYDPESGSGSVLTDEGVVLPFEVAALRLSGLRHLRPGQRLTVELDPENPENPGDPGDRTGSRRITGLTLGTIGSTLRD